MLIQPAGNTRPDAICPMPTPMSAALSVFPDCARVDGSNTKLVTAVTRNRGAFDEGSTRRTGRLTTDGVPLDAFGLRLPNDTVCMVLSRSAAALRNTLLPAPAITTILTSERTPGHILDRTSWGRLIE